MILVLNETDHPIEHPENAGDILEMRLRPNIQESLTSVGFILQLWTLRSLPISALVKNVTPYHTSSRRRLRVSLVEAQYCRPSLRIL